MAYNNYFPATYQPIYQQPYQQTQQQMMQNTTGVQSGFVRVQNENEARMYPVAPGNSVTFINENEPYCYTKSVDLSQLDRPKFEKYRLVKEEDTSPEQSTQSIEYATKAEFEQLREVVMEMQGKMIEGNTET